MCLKKLKHTVSLNVKFCRGCHRIIERASLSCPSCNRIALVAIRLRVHRDELAAFYEAYPFCKPSR